MSASEKFGFFKENAKNDTKKLLLMLILTWLEIISEFLI